jgi:hypothetical protein
MLRTLEPLKQVGAKVLLLQKMSPGTFNAHLLVMALAIGLGDGVEHVNRRLVGIPAVQRKRAQQSFQLQRSIPAENHH